MTCVRKNRICDSDKRSHEFCLHCYTEIGDREVDACVNHADDVSYKNVDDAGYTEPE